MKKRKRSRSFYDFFDGKLCWGERKKCEQVVFFIRRGIKNLDTKLKSENFILKEARFSGCTINVRGSL